MPKAHIKLFGIEVRMDPSWILLAVLIAWTLASGVFPDLYAGLPRFSYWGMAAVAVAGIAVSIVLHELGHSLTARAFGLPIRSITLFVFGGVAEMEREPRSPWVELIMAIAGPLVSVILGFVFAAASIGLGQQAGTREAVGVLEYLGTLNFMLAVFNMAPAFPLDGGRVLRALIWLFTGDALRATRIASHIGEAMGGALIAAGAITTIATGLAAGLWWVLLGWFVYSMARSHRRDAEARQQLSGATVADAMTREVATAPADMQVERFIDTVLARRPHDLYPVVSADGEVLGGVGFMEAEAARRSGGEGKTLREIAVPLSSIPISSSGEPIVDALARMQTFRASRSIVIDGGSLKGMLTLKDVMDHLRFRAAFANADRQASQA